MEASFLKLISRQTKYRLFRQNIDYIENIYFLGVNTKYISSIEVKKNQYFSQVHSTSENADIFTKQNEIYLVCDPQKVNFLFILY